MAITSGFFNSINHDRVYDAVQMSSMFDGIINDGVLISYGDKMLVAPNGGMHVVVGTGKAWFRHTWTLNDSSLDIELEPSDPLVKRIDAIYLEVNNSTRINTISVKKGDNAKTDEEPVKPTMEQSSVMKQYPLAYINVEAGVTEITESLIENAVGTDACPFANGLIEQVTSDKLFAQWGAQFIDWWNGLRDTMQPIPDDRTLKLQNEIDSLKIWIKDEVIAKGTKSKTISNGYIKESSVIDIYYDENSVKEITARDPKYVQREGLLQIDLNSECSNDIIIKGIHVYNIPDNIY